MPDSKAKAAEIDKIAQQADEHQTLKQHLAKVFRASGHVAAAGVESLAEVAASIALAGKFGE
jgi:hypothetical protein